MTLGENFLAAFEAGRDRIGQPQHFQRTRPVGQAADEAALLQRRDQAVDAGLGSEVERVLHFVEGGRDAGFLQPLMDEQEKFVLLARQHRTSPRNQIKTKPEQTLSVPVVFRNCLNFNECR